MLRPLYARLEAWPGRISRAPWPGAHGCGEFGIADWKKGIGAFAIHHPASALAARPHFWRPLGSNQKNRQVKYWLRGFFPEMRENQAE
jgi:hypothetical protein